MGSSTEETSEHTIRHERSVDAVARSGRWVLIATAVLLLIGSIGVMIVQVTVPVDEDGTTRACGSALDSLTNRTGWEQWWANDLDEPAGPGRGELIRTTSCPSALNRMIGTAAVLAAVGTVLAASARVARPATPTNTTASEGVARMGRILSWVGLTAAITGTIGVVALIMDDEAELFLYIDRAVVGLIGLIVVMPAIATFAIGRTLVVLGARAEPAEVRHHD